MREILCNPKIRFVPLSDATRQGCRNRVGAQNKAAFSCNLTIHDAEFAGNFSFFHGCFMPSCVNFVVTNVSRFSADNDPGRGVATASLKPRACSAPSNSKNGSACAYRTWQPLAHTQLRLQDMHNVHHKSIVICIVMLWPFFSHECFE